MRLSDPVRSLPGGSGMAGQPGASQNPDDVDEGVVLSLRHRMINLHSMGWPLRLLTLGTLLFLAGAGVLLWASTLPQGQVQVNATLSDLAIVVPISVFVFMVITLLLALTLMLTGALHMHGGLRYPVLALVTIMLGAGPALALHLLTPAVMSPAAITFDSEIRLVQFAILAVFWIWALRITLSRRARTARRRPRWGYLATMFLVAGLLLTYYGLEAVVWLYLRDPRVRSLGTVMLEKDLTVQTYLVPLLLGVVVYWASTDLAEWGESLALSAIHLVRRTRLPALLFAVTILAAAGMIFDVLRTDIRFILPQFVMVALAAMAIALVVRFAHIGREWPPQVPFLALTVGALFVYGSSFFFLLMDIAPFFGALPTLTTLGSGAQYSIGSMVAAGVYVLGITIGLLLVARGRAPGRHKTGAIGLFLTMVALISLLTNLPDLLTAANIQGVFVPQMSLDALRLVAAVGVLVLTLWLAIGRRATSDPTAPLARAFMLLAGLQCITWLLQASALLSAQDALPVAATAGLFLLAVYWDVLMSGEQITNQHTGSFPRPARVLVYLGYSMIAAVTLIYVGAERLQATNAPVPLVFGVDVYSHQGLLYLGVPLLVAGFILAYGRWRGIERSQATTAPAPIRRAVGVGPQLAILGVGGLALALVLVVTLVNVVPHLNAQDLSPFARLPYIATAPGSGCDPYGAGWNPSAGTGATCSAAGMQVSVPAAHPNGFVIFTTPDGFGHLPQKYQVSVHVDMSALVDGCAGILVRYTAFSAEAHLLCTNDHFSIQHFDLTARKVTILAQAGPAVPALVYNVQATVDGMTQSLSIAGGGTVSAPDTPHMNFEQVGLIVFNDNGTTQSATFSDFIFTPLT